MRNKFVFVILAAMLCLIVGVVSAQEPVTVTWWTEDYVDVESLNTLLVEPFNTAHPDIRLEVIPQSGLDDAVRTAFTAGSAPDILQTPGASFIGEYVDAGLIYPLNAAAAELGWQEKLLPWAYESGVLDGELYSIPLTFESMILLYNKTLFEEMGWTAPTTYAELQAIAEAAQAAGINPYGYGNVGWQANNEHVVGVYLNNYAGADKVYAALTGKKAWTDPEFVEAIKLLNSHMADEHWFNDSLETWFAYGWNEFFTALATRESAMMIVGTWGFRGADEFFAETGDEWDWAPIPPFSD
ncbi:MAG: extracellular solute-binding protein, partial [Anaerolineae bacterium]|nr:extracellular solute-binding protein [Anaerolineae bacterium]